MTALGGEHARLTECILREPRNAGRIAVDQDGVPLTSLSRYADKLLSARWYEENSKFELAKL